MQFTITILAAILLYVSLSKKNPIACFITSYLLILALIPHLEPISVIAKFGFSEVWRRSDGGYKAVYLLTPVLGSALLMYAVHGICRATILMQDIKRELSQ